MAANKGILQTDLFYIHHLDPHSAGDLQAIDKFYIANRDAQGLDNYLKDAACSDEDDNTMRTYLVRFKETDECVGYFSLKAGLISKNERDETYKDPCIRIVPHRHLSVRCGTSSLPFFPMQEPPVRRARSRILHF